MTKIPISIIEDAGIERTDEPVTFGIPFPKGRLSDPAYLEFTSGKIRLPLQTEILAKWNDGSIQWLLIDSQISLAANETREFSLKIKKNVSLDFTGPEIEIIETNDSFTIDTGCCQFVVGKQVFQPFRQVLVNNEDVLNSEKSRIILLDSDNQLFKPIIHDFGFETKDAWRSTLKIAGKFQDERNRVFANFLARIHFYAGKSLVKIDFTLHNPRAASHPRGLWDLGDPGSVFFKDLALNIALTATEKLTVDWTVNSHGAAKYTDSSNFRLYQDSSGGKNWHSRNHANRFGQIKTSFSGYKIFLDDYEIQSGKRANPSVSLKSADKNISGTVRHFWQNFPKSIEIHNETLTIRLFPTYYVDDFELQGGEQKTHTIFLDFAQDSPRLNWIDHPLLPHASPAWYAGSELFPAIQPTAIDNPLAEFLNTAIEGENSFFARREIIDEYGWRNFGEFYADHESVEQPADKPFISHYNNQYDGIWGGLIRFLQTGNSKWFHLSNQLCSHVRDIDIYHTDQDRIFYNHGLFWHTDHYSDAGLATHRCYSRKNLHEENRHYYGGGPSLSHNYASGLLLHYYLTGDHSSKDAVSELTLYIMNNIKADKSPVEVTKKVVKKIIGLKDLVKSKEDLVQFNKVYGLDGPGRASGNALSTLIDGYTLSENPRILQAMESLINKCISLRDDIAKRDLPDFENRWMYTVFLQALCKYLIMKETLDQKDTHWQYAKNSLMHYARWMKDHEVIYLESPEKLEYPNETWAAQELRKSIIFLAASKYAQDEIKAEFVAKANYFCEAALRNLGNFSTSSLTRPIVLMLQNGGIISELKVKLSRQNSHSSIGYE